MQWTDEGVILGTRRHGETSLIVELMTAAHGRHLGLVKGGRSRRHQAVLQPGNGVRAVWRARLSEHLGNWTLEPVSSRAARLMGSAAGLYGLLREDRWVETGGSIEQWIADAAARGRLAPAVFHPAAARVLERPVDRLWPLPAA